VSDQASAPRRDPAPDNAAVTTDDLADVARARSAHRGAHIHKSTGCPRVNRTVREELARPCAFRAHITVRASASTLNHTCGTPCQKLRLPVVPSVPSRDGSDRRLPEGRPTPCAWHLLASERTAAMESHPRPAPHPARRHVTAATRSAPRHPRTSPRPCPGMQPDMQEGRSPVVREPPLGCRRRRAAFRRDVLDAQSARSMTMRRDGSRPWLWLTTPA
jgi:hypothetical protein